MPLTIQSCIASHPGDRPEQQDRVNIFAHPQHAGFMLAVLADGMGGHAGGALAAEQVITRARQSFEAFNPASETPRELLASIIADAHLAVRLARYTTALQPHSTIVALLLQPGRADWVHCGDSRIYHLRGGRVLSRSEDHSLVAELLRRARIAAHEVADHPQRNVLLSCLGGEREPEFACGGTHHLRPDDVFMLCSDGIWSWFDDTELAQHAGRQPASAAARELVTLARARAGGTGDNLALAVIRLGSGAGETAARPAPWFSEPVQVPGV